MARPNFEAATQYALGRLDQELDPQLRYHSIAHTRDDVLPAAERLAALEGVYDADLLLLRTAASFHDLGFVVQREGHEAIGAQIAATVLPGFGYSAEQIAVICGIIMATRTPQMPKTLLEQIMADADLDVVGREDFLARNEDLRAELAAYGMRFSDEQWYRSQLDFLDQHTYWTAAAHQLRDAGKQQHSAQFRALLAQAQATLPQP
jgi:uncharacterized protein